MTKTYSIRSDGNEHFVTWNNGTEVNGPYKNEESAKRRIRDLKRRDREDAEMNEQRESPFDADEPSNIVPQDAVTPEQRAFINTGRFTNIADGDIDGTLRTADAANDPQARSYENRFDTYEPNVHKLAASSAYGTMRRGEAAFRKYSNGVIGSDPGWTNPPFDPYRGQSRNGYRPAHRANRLRSKRR